MSDYNGLEFQQHSDYDFLLKVILIGDSGVGKSCLLKSYMTREYEEAYTSTIGVDFEIKQVVLQDKKVNLQIWDTAGQERFRTITTSYYRVSDVVILVFDVCLAESFRNVKNWLEDVREYANEKVDIMLVGNKIDLEDKRQVSYDDAKGYADEQGLPYMETSAKTGLNVDNMFTAISLTALGHKMEQKALKSDADKKQQNINISDDAADFCGC